MNISVMSGMAFLQNLINNLFLMLPDVVVAKLCITFLIMAVKVSIQICILRLQSSPGDAPLSPGMFQDLGPKVYLSQEDEKLISLFKHLCKLSHCSDVRKSNYSSFVTNMHLRSDPRPPILPCIMASSVMGLNLEGHWVLDDHTQNQTQTKCIHDLCEDLNFSPLPG